MLYEHLLPQFIKMLGNLNNVLDRAAAFADAKRIDFDVLLRSRLAPDQFDLRRQIQITCDSVKVGVARLAGKEKEAPIHNDTEQSLNELRERIQSVITYLKTFKAQDFANLKTIKISQPRWEGRHLLGEEFLTQHMMPNFYFHFTTAYSILRHNGVEIGKKDYLGPLPYKN